MKFKKDMTNSKADIKQAFEDLQLKLEKMILIGEIKPRERLVEADLSERLGVSRSWVRDALKLLEAKGLVKMVPYKGALVADLTPREVEEIFFVRVALERVCYQRVVSNFLPIHGQKLRELAADIKRASQQGRFDLMITANANFHDYIYELSGNQTLIQMIKQLKARFFIFNTFAWSLPEMMHRVMNEHLEIIEALETGDLESLYRLAEQHIAYSKNLYLSQIQGRVT